MSSALLENPLREGVGEGAGLHNPLVTWQGGWAQGLSGVGDPQGWGGGRQSTFSNQVVSGETDLFGNNSDLFCVVKGHLCGIYLNFIFFKL